MSSNAARGGCSPAIAVPCANRDGSEDSDGDIIEVGASAGGSGALLLDVTHNVVSGGQLPQHGGESQCLGSLRVGTWNMSHWTVAKASLVAYSLAVDVLAVQETHLAKIPLEVAHTSARNAGLRLQHGHPVPRSGPSEHARSRGVGFLCKEGIASVPFLPSCPAWRRLHAMCRLHGIQLSPRRSLPHGIILLSVYAPLPNQVDRGPFNVAFLELVHSLDMQVPTLLMGDFNGSLSPSDDYQSASGARRPVCPLLAQLLGPGAPWVDVHRLLMPPPLPWTYYQSTSDGVAASRIDLVLANSAALRLVRSVSVQSSVRDSGHSPVLVTLSVDPGRVEWRPPQPRPPRLLLEPSRSLTASQQWTALVDQWLQSPEVRALAPQPTQSLDALSSSLRAALERLVALAGGWTTRPKTRRLAYDSNVIRRHRSILGDLHRLDVECRRAGPQPGPWPRFLTSLIDSLQRRGAFLPRDGSRTALLTAIATLAEDQPSGSARCAAPTTR